MAKADLAKALAPVKKPKASKPKKKAKKTGSDDSKNYKDKLTTPTTKTLVTKSLVMKSEEDNEKYPILKDMKLVEKFLKVPLTNNQKGRIRQNMKDSLKNSNNAMIPEIINSTIQNILNSTPNLTDSDLRKVRILYNMLKTAMGQDQEGTTSPTRKEKPTHLDTQVAKRSTLDRASSPKTLHGDVKKTVHKEEKPKVKADKISPTGDFSKPKVQTTPKGVKRYVVFLGNLPLDVTKEMIMLHFTELATHIVNVRIPKQTEGKKSAIAYLELKNEPSYELALSKHHTMMGRKRIKVLYTTQKNSKITKTQAKSKSAKLIALQKSGQLTGSMPMNRKRSHRRKKQRAARAIENKDI